MARMISIDADAIKKTSGTGSKQAASTNPAETTTTTTTNSNNMSEEQQIIAAHDPHGAEQTVSSKWRIACLGIPCQLVVSNHWHQCH